MSNKKYYVIKFEENLIILVSKMRCIDEGIKILDIASFKQPFNAEINSFL